MYFDFFGLRINPFNITPDPDFLYLSPSHKQALGSLIYGIKQRKGFIAVTGQVGLGKTTILRSFLNLNQHADQETVYLLNPNLSFTSLLKTLLHELGHDPVEGDEAEVLEQLHFVLIEKYREGRTVALLIDEAQNMPVNTLEHLRMLSNLETPKDKLIQIVLLGQPELDSLLDRYELRQLRQRIAMRAMIQPLSKTESLEYIRHRLDKAGGEGKKIFTNSALTVIVQEAKGIPRRLNILCDNALVTAFGYNKALVTAKIAKEVIGDLRGRSTHPLWKLIPLIGLAFILVLALVALLPLTQSKFSDIPSRHEIGQLDKDRENPGQDLVPDQDSVNEGQNIAPPVQNSLTLSEKAQTFLTESVSNVFEKLQNQVGSNYDSTTTQPNEGRNIDPANQEDLLLAGIASDNFQDEGPKALEELEVSAAPKTVSPGILPPRPELFDLSTQKEGLAKTEAVRQKKGEPLAQAKTTPPPENAREANLLQLSPEKRSDPKGQTTIAAEELISPPSQDSSPSVPVAQSRVSLQESPRKQPEVSKSPSPLTSTVQKGDTMATLLLNGYGSASASPTQFIAETDEKLVPGEEKRFSSSKGNLARSTAKTQTNEINSEANRATPYAVATVQKGDTLEQLIKVVYGSSHPSYIERVLAYNPKILNPQKIFPGQDIAFPKLPKEVKTQADLASQAYSSE